MKILPFNQRWLWQALKEGTGIERPPPVEAELRLPFKGPEDLVIPTAPVDAPPVAVPGAYDNISADGHRDYAKTLKGNLRRRYSAERLADRRLVVVHQMAVRFGTTSRARKRWAKMRAKEEGRTELNEADWAYAETMALFERFWKVPYHEVSLISGYVVDNNRTDDYTYHAGKLNYALSWAIEGRFPPLASKRTSKHTELTDDLIETGRAGLRRAILRFRADGAAADQLAPHRTGSKNRLADCGEEVWKEIVLPVASELDCEVLYDFKRSTGRPIPLPWDDNALYDYKGNRL